MRTRYKAPVEDTYFVTSTIVDWIKIFSLKDFPEIIIDELKFRREKKQIEIYGYVIMPIHLHMIISSENIPKAMRSFKCYTAKRIIEKLKEDNKKAILNKLKISKPDYKYKSEYQVWQEGFQPKMILGISEYRQKMNYIHNNPVARGLVESPDEWKYSSYNFFFGDTYLLDMDY